MESETLTFMGKPVAHIAPDYTIELQDGLAIAGDARLVQALRSGKIARITALERFPPVFVVVYSDGTESRYQSRRQSPRP